jgi:hypothetical protein
VAKTPVWQYRAWDKKLEKMRTVQSVSVDRKYVILKDKPAEKVPIENIDLLRKMGLTSTNRRGIYEGDIVKFRHGTENVLGLVVRDKEKWFFNILHTDEKIEPWNIREIEVLGNKYENAYYMSDEYARAAMIREIREILGCHDVCDNHYCRHDLQLALDRLQELNREELKELVLSLAEEVRIYKQWYYAERDKNSRLRQ